MTFLVVIYGLLGLMFFAFSKADHAQTWEAFFVGLLWPLFLLALIITYAVLVALRKW